MPRLKKKFKRVKPSSDSSDSESHSCEDDYQNAVKSPITSAKKRDEFDLQSTGIFYEAIGLLDFNQVLDTCPRVCVYESLPPVVHEMTTFLTECLDFDLKLDAGKIEGEHEQMTSKQILKILKLTLEKLHTLSLTVGEEFSCSASMDEHSAAHLSYAKKYHCIYNAKNFTKDIIQHIEYVNEYEFPVVEMYFSTMISHFGSMCNLEGQYGLYNQSMLVNSMMVTSIPDVRFLYTEDTGVTNMTVSIVKVKTPNHKNGDGKRNKVLIKTGDSSILKDEKKTAEFNINNFVGKDVLGQHGKELLVESKHSAKGLFENKQSPIESHIFGMIVVGVEVVLTSLYITGKQIRQINYEGIISGAKRGIKYSKPLNILSSADRKQLYKILFRLAEKL